MNSLLQAASAALLILCHTASAFAVERVEKGNLVTEDVPAIPAALAERMNQYQQTRSASFEGWLPEGGILITTRFGETSQVHRVATPLGMREQLTFFSEPVTGAAASPAGGSFLYGKDIGGNEQFQVYRYDFASGDTRLLSDGKSRNTGARWSRDGRQYAYSTTQRNGRDTDIHVATPDGTSRAVLEREGMWSVLDWSPDDSRLLLGKYLSITESELHVLTLKTGAITRFHPATEAIGFGDAKFSSDGKGVYYISDEGSEFGRLRYENLDGSGARVLSAGIPWDVEEVALSDDGRTLAYSVNAGGLGQLHLINLRTHKALPVPTLPVGALGSLQFDRAGKRLGFALNGPRSPSDVFSFEVGKSALTRWTRSETGGLHADRFVEPALIEFPSFDGRKIPAFYYKPEPELGPEATSIGKVPVLISIHGGPEAQALPLFAPITEFYLRELGVAVIYPNVRGSAGYGKSYLKLDNGFLREDSVKDIGALLDWIAQQPELDASRIAVMGGSYGGYMTLASMTHYNDRLRAGIDIVGISNFVTFLTNTADYRRDLRRVEYGDERNEAMRKHLEAISPTTNARRISKPMFIVQGANDPRVPASEAEQMVQTIRGNGGAVWYLLAKDEGHGFKKKSNRDIYNNAVVLFLQKHLLGK